MTDLSKIRILHGKNTIIKRLNKLKRRSEHAVLNIGVTKTSLKFEVLQRRSVEKNRNDQNKQ